MNAFIRTEIAGNVGTITLSRPQDRNAVNPVLLEELAAAIRVADADVQVRAIILTADGVFSAGGDLNKLQESTPAARPDEAKSLDAALEPSRLLLGSSKPSLALIRGAAAGAGLALALACDFRIATGNTKLVFAYGRIGLAGDLGSTWLLSRLLGARAAYRFAMQPYVSAREAKEIGLVDEVVADDALEAAGQARINGFLAIPPAALAAIKSNLRQAEGLDFETACRIEAETFIRLRASADHREAVAAFLERRQPHFTGS